MYTAAWGEEKSCPTLERWPRNPVSLLAPLDAASDPWLYWDLSSKHRPSHPGRLSCRHSWLQELSIPWAGEQANHRPHPVTSPCDIMAGRRRGCKANPGADTQDVQTAMLTSPAQAAACPTCVPVTAARVPSQTNASSHQSHLCFHVPCLPFLWQVLDTHGSKGPPCLQPFPYCACADTFRIPVWWEMLVPALPSNEYIFTGEPPPSAPGEFLAFMVNRVGEN